VDRRGIRLLSVNSNRNAISKRRCTSELMTSFPLSRCVVACCASSSLEEAGLVEESELLLTRGAGWQ
jgi:hypothetical protein